MLIVKVKSGFSTGLNEECTRVSSRSSTSVFFPFLRAGLVAGKYEVKDGCTLLASCTHCRSGAVDTEKAESVACLIT